MHVVADIALICPTFQRCQTSETFPEVRGHVAMTREKPLNGKKSLFTRLEHGSLQNLYITTAKKEFGFRLKKANDILPNSAKQRKQISRYFFLG